MSAEGSNIIPFPDRGVEYINGEAQALGRMSLRDLLAIEADCRMQLEAAQTDLMIVVDYRERLYPDGDGAA